MAGERLAEAGRCRGDDAMEFQLVCRARHGLTGFVVADLAAEKVLGQADGLPPGACSKVQYVRGRDTARKQSAGTDSARWNLRVEDRLDEVPVGFDDDRGDWSADVQDAE